MVAVSVGLLWQRMKCVPVSLGMRGQSGAVTRFEGGTYFQKKTSPYRSGVDRRSAIFEMKGITPSLVCASSGRWIGPGAQDVLVRTL